jgi:hypothetical protein
LNKGEQMKTITKLMKSALLVIPITAMSFAAFLNVSPVSAAETKASCMCGEANQVMSLECGTVCASNDEESCLFGEDAYGDPCLFNKIINVALFLIGAISVVMLIYGGIRYTVSGGKQEAVTNAKNTILYAVVGIVVAMLAYAIVGFVVGQLV